MPLKVWPVRPELVLSIYWCTHTRLNKPWRWNLLHQACSIDWVQAIPFYIRRQYLNWQQTLTTLRNFVRSEVQSGREAAVLIFAIRQYKSMTPKIETHTFQRHTLILCTSHAELKASPCGRLGWVLTKALQQRLQLRSNSKIALLPTSEVRASWADSEYRPQTTQWMPASPPSLPLRK